MIFTGGVGERSAEVRERTVERLRFLGLSLDGERNRGASGDADVSHDGAAAKTLVVLAREDIEIAHQTRRLLADG